MPRRGATVTQADVARIIRAARQAGASTVEVPVRSGPPVVIRLFPEQVEVTPLEDSSEIVL